ncbi:MAG: NAD-dependent epimerase/dehydratase family protein [Planctomycetaceae bacterium]|jgi:nucleoside-diphosphate-sugar epimerase|nr:NAD-dependent epimerase/dehydratase family protein [Planctomycetaceae bacterium]
MNRLKIFIIGGTKFIGTAITEQLTQSKHEVVLFHRNIDANIRHEQIQGDCNNVNDLEKALEIVKPDVIIHNIALFQNQINVLEQALQGKKKRVILLSSIDVYKAYEIFFGLSGEPVVSVPFNEASPLREILYPYRGKLETDFAHDYEKILVEHAALQSPVMDVVILRLGMVYGKNDPNRRFAEPVKKMRQNAEQIELPETMAEFRACKCYVKDIAYGIKLAAESNICREIYNLAGLETLTELEWYKEIADVMNWRGDIVITQTNFISGNINPKQHLTADTTKIRKQLGYKEIFSRREGLEETIYWELALPDNK